MLTMSSEAPFMYDAGTYDYIHWCALGKDLTTAEVLVHVDRLIAAINKFGNSGRYIIDHNCPTANRDGFIAQMDNWKKLEKQAQDLKNDIAARNN
jgi:hypothetical protein